MSKQQPIRGVMSHPNNEQSRWGVVRLAPQPDGSEYIAGPIEVAKHIESGLITFVQNTPILAPRAEQAGHRLVGIYPSRDEAAAVCVEQQKGCKQPTPPVQETAATSAAAMVDLAKAVQQQNALILRMLERDQEGAAARAAAAEAELAKVNKKG